MSIKEVTKKILDVISNFSIFKAISANISTLKMKRHLFLAISITTKKNWTNKNIKNYSGIFSNINNEKRTVLWFRKNSFFIMTYFLMEFSCNYVVLLGLIWFFFSRFGVFVIWWFERIEWCMGTRIDYKWWGAR